LVKESLQILKEQWLPLPFFGKIGDSGQPFYFGPLNWARVFLAQLSDAENGHDAYHVVLAFDTKTWPEQTNPEEQDLPEFPYLRPYYEDVENGRKFALAHKIQDVENFLAQDWIDGWLRAAVAGQVKNKAAPEAALSHQLHYLNLLQVLGTKLDLPKIRLLPNRPDAGVRPIAVDLILDIGNSRTCAILHENIEKAHGGMDSQKNFHLRDLGQPHYKYEEPFESRVEFSLATFGNVYFSAQSGLRGTSAAFVWPGMVRTGQQAMRLAMQRSANQGMSGISSPKRYLWDEEKYPYTWYFNQTEDNAQDGDKNSLATMWPMNQYINGEGQPLDELADDNRVSVMHPHYSRSSLMCFMLCEVLAHAMAQINNPQRLEKTRHPDVPRQLRHITLTVPPAMPAPERKIFERRMEQAIGLVWRCNGWCPDNREVPFRELADKCNPPLPDVHVQWDEATCAQMVYLYNEVETHFAGHPERFFAAMQLPQNQSQDGRSLRIASIDIGGGTTDLTVTQYSMGAGKGSNAPITPKQLFREGFKIAGDDILLDLIDRFILPALKKKWEEKGVQNVETLLADLLGKKSGLSVQEQSHRQQLAVQIFAPLGLALLKKYEEYDPLVDEEKTATFSQNFAKIVSDGVSNGALKKFATDVKKLAREKQPEKNNITEDELLGVSLKVSLYDVHAAFLGDAERMNIARTLKALSEVLRLCHPDVLLLAGRTSILPGVQALLRKFLPLPPARIVPLRHYPVGGWYPFRVQGRIEDPKTTAVTGALLCRLATQNKGVKNFHFTVPQSHLVSTLRFLGKIDPANLIAKDDVFINDIDLNDPQYTIPDDAFFNVAAPLHLGFRQLASERWPATPLYLLIPPAEVPEGVTSFRVRLAHKKEEGMDTFFIAAAQADDGTQVAQTILENFELRLNTLNSSALDEVDYWLDSGNMVHS